MRQLKAILTLYAIWLLLVLLYNCNCCVAKTPHFMAVICAMNYHFLSWNCALLEEEEVGKASWRVTIR